MKIVQFATIDQPSRALPVPPAMPSPSAVLPAGLQDLQNEFRSLKPQIPQLIERMQQLADEVARLSEDMAVMRQLVEKLISGKAQSPQIEQAEALPLENIAPPMVAGSERKVAFFSKVWDYLNADSTGR
jgi:hypothetical protein